MTQTMKRILAACASTLFIAACTTPAPQIAAVDAKPDPRQGEEVRNICFQSQIRNWRKLDSRSVIVEVRVKDEYKLELTGACQPDDAFLSIGLVSRTGSACLDTGSELVTDARYLGGTCSIRKIYKWNKDATAPAAS